MRRNTAFAPITACALLCAGAAAIFAIGAARGRFLVEAGTGARWLVASTPGWLKMLPIAPSTGAFRITFTLDRPHDAGVLRLRAVERAEVALDGEVIHRDAEPQGRALREVSHPALAAGEHELTVSVVATASPPLLWLRSDSLPISTTLGAPWWFKWDLDPGIWRFARFASDGPAPFSISRQFPHAGHALLVMLPALLPLFALAFAWDWRGWRAPTPARLRLGLLGFWAAMAVNNIGALRPDLGMDVDMHLAYVRVLVTGHRIPLSTEGGEMMQPPLAYLLYALLYVPFSEWLNGPAAVQAMRILPFACAAAQVELAYRAARIVFPDRTDLQRTATVVGGLLPINVYLAHGIANEPVVALFGGAAAVATLRMTARDRLPSPRELVAAGLLLGLAMLSKVTAVLLAPALFAVVALRSLGSERALARAGKAIGLVAGVAALVAGWYYARNWILLGTPFLGAWSPEIPNPWWQEPGYRTAAQYLRFGEALTHPIFAAAVGLWDGLYSSFWLDSWLSGKTSRASAPPWNAVPLVAGAWLGLVPSLAIAAGMLRTLRRAGLPPREGLALRIAAGTVTLYTLAILYLHLTAPFYCSAKGTYLAAATPFFAVLAAAGFAELARARWVHAALTAALVCWVANVVATYWVV